MSKTSDLKKLYEKIELDSSNGRLLLSRAKNGIASEVEINELLEIIKANKNGVIVLNEIISFEESLISEINDRIGALEEMETENIDLAHCDDESLQNHRYADMKKRYKTHIAKAEEIIDALEVAYFQIINYQQYEERLYIAKEPLTYLD